MSKPQKTSIKELLNLREENYKKETDKIFELYGHKLNNLAPFIANYDREVTWDTITRYSPESNILCVFAIVKYMSGDVIQTKDGPKCVLKDGFESSIRFLITNTGLETKETMDMIREIKALESYEKTLSPRESYEIFSDPEFTGIIDTEKLLNREMKEETNTEDFDLSKLTQEQQEKLLQNGDGLFLNEKGTLN